MATQKLQLDDTHQDGHALHGVEWDILSRILESYGTGAMEILAAGIIAIPDETSWQVSAGSGLLVNVAAGAGIALHSTYGHIFIKSAVANEVEDLTDDSSDNYIFAAIRIGVLDSREYQFAQFVVNDSDTLDGALLLAKVTTASGSVTEIEDLRDYWPLQDALNDIVTLAGQVSDIEDVIGYPWSVEELGTIKSWLQSLSGTKPKDPANGGGGGASYLTALPVSPIDATDSKTYMDAEIADVKTEVIALIPGESGVGTGTTVISVWDEFIANQMQTAMMLVRMQPGLEGQFPWMRFIVADHAALGLTNHIHAASTMPYDTMTGVFG